MNTNFIVISLTRLGIKSESTVGMCLKENYSDSPSNEYLRRRHDSASPSVYDVTHDGKCAFACLVFLHLAAPESLS